MDAEISEECQALMRLLKKQNPVPLLANVKFDYKKWFSNYTGYKCKSKTCVNQVGQIPQTLGYCMSQDEKCVHLINPKEE